VTTIHEQREDLLKTLTHDVRTPLGVIMTQAGILERDPNDAAGVLRRARAIERSAASVADMLGDLVDAAHLESGHFQLERQPVELARFAEELRSRLEETLAVERIRLAIPADLPAVEVDPHRFERILVNLLSNALKYSPAPVSVVLGAALQGREIVVSVSDSGPGIAAEDLPRIFEKYYRTSAARTKEGLGLGLYATRLLVQEHGGRVWVESVLGEGTTFHVALPAVGGPGLSAPRPDVQPGSPPPFAPTPGTSPSGSEPRSSRGG
jgi:signal transduction histidine kinase